MSPRDVFFRIKWHLLVVLRAPVAINASTMLFGETHGKVVKFDPAARTFTTRVKGTKEEILFDCGLVRDGFRNVHAEHGKQPIPIPMGGGLQTVERRATLEWALW